MKDKILNIAKDLKKDKITEYQAQQRLLSLFGVTEITHNIESECTHKNIKGELTVEHSEWGEPYCKQCHKNIR